MLDSVSEKMISSLKQQMASKETKFAAAISKLDVLSPIKTMLRGYSVVQKNGKAINSAKNLLKGDKISIMLSDGKKDCTVD